MSINKLSTNASLKDVMDKFEEISLLDLFGANIIVSKELPHSVVNGQIVIVTDNKVGKIHMNFDINELENVAENDVFLKYYTDTGRNKFIIGNSNVKIAIYIYGFVQYINGEYVKISSYIGKDNVWASMNELVLYDYGTIPLVTGGYSLEAAHTSYTKAQFKGDHIYIWRRYGVSGYVSRATTVNAIDLAPYKTLFVEATTQGGWYIQILNSKGTTVLKSLNVNDGDGVTKKIYRVDISTISEDCKIRLEAPDGTYDNVTLHIYKVWAE